MNAAEWTKQEFARLSRKIDFEHLPPRREISVNYRIIKIERLAPVSKKATAEPVK